jgi:hypothetical protein
MANQPIQLLGLNSLLRQAPYKLLHHAIELPRIVDEQRVFISTKPLQPNLVSKFCFRKSAFGWRF